MALAGGGSVAELERLASRWYEDPFDPSRPLWQFTIVDGIEGGRGALFAKLHHTISDGIGLLRLAERYIDVEREPPLPEDVDLDRLIAESASGQPSGPPSHPSPLDVARNVARIAHRPQGTRR